MTDTLVDPETIPTLDEIDFENLHGNVGKIRRTCGDVQRGGSAIDGQWAAGVALHYLAPNGTVLSEKLTPLKQNSAAVAKSCQGAADALAGYASKGAPIKKALKQLKRDAQDLVAKAKPLGDDWQSKHELVEENNRIKSAVTNKVNDHEQAQKDCADKIHATNDGPGTNAGGLIREYGGYLGYGTTSWGAIVSNANYHKFGEFRPRGADGKYIKFKDMPFWERAKLGMETGAPWQKKLGLSSNSNWQAKAYQSASRAKWLKLGKFGGPIGVGLTAVTSGMDQWGQDSQNPNMSTGTKVVRTGAKAVGTAGGAWAGAEAGAAIGTGIGAACGGVGAPVGAVVGGLIGAAVGSGIGSKIADGFNSLFG